MIGVAINARGHTTVIHTNGLPDFCLHKKVHARQRHSESATGLVAKEALRDLQMTDALMGRTLLPWERLGPLPPEQRNKLGIMRKPVLSLLERDPEKRPAMAVIVALLSALFEGNLPDGAYPPPVYLYPSCLLVVAGGS